MVTHQAQIKQHVRHDEILIRVPKIVVHEPIAWGDYPSVIATVEFHVRKWCETRPNQPYAQEAIRMYRLRQLEGKFGRSLDLHSIVET